MNIKNEINLLKIGPEKVVSEYCFNNWSIFLKWYKLIKLVYFEGIK